MKKVFTYQNIGSPAPTKIAKVLDSYRNEGTALIGCISDGKLVGVIGVDGLSLQTNIRHLCVLPEYRSLGIGRKLVHYVTTRFLIRERIAETDDEAVGFYKSLEFTCIPFEGPYGKRHFCKKLI